MPDLDHLYEKILKEKIDYCGDTKAAYDFAAHEYAIEYHKAHIPEPNILIFEINTSQLEKLTKWRESIKEEYGSYGHYAFTFSDTGLGQSIKVYSLLTQQTLDLSEYDKW